MNKIVRLDLVSNSFCRVLIKIRHKKETLKIVDPGSRISPIDAVKINDLINKGKTAFPEKLFTKGKVEYSQLNC